MQLHADRKTGGSRPVSAQNRQRGKALRRAASVGTAAGRGIAQAKAADLLNGSARVAQLRALQRQANARPRNAVPHAVPDIRTMPFQRQLDRSARAYPQSTLPPIARARGHANNDNSVFRQGANETGRPSSRLIHPGSSVADSVGGPFVSPGGIIQPRALVAPRPLVLPTVQLAAAAAVIQAIGGRSITSPQKHGLMYFGGWVADIVDMYTRGKFYDTIRLIYGLTGDSNAGALAKVEEMVRFVLNHPEIIEYAAQLAPYLAMYFGVPPWTVQILLSRGRAADSIGEYLIGLLPGWAQAYAQYAPVRRIGKSILDRGLNVTYNLASYIPHGDTVVSGLSRLLHGFSLNPGTVKKTDKDLQSPGKGLQPLYGLLSGFMPMERLHIVPPKRRVGKKRDYDKTNVAYGSTATNSLMIPSEKINRSALAVQSPTGMLESMTMNWGLFRGRGVRPREGFIEHWFAQGPGKGEKKKKKREENESSWRKWFSYLA